MFLVALLLLAFALGYLVVRNTVQKTVDHQALSIAQVVASQAATARTVYSREIAEKLRRDGSGPSENFLTMPGHVPIPAQFLKQMAQAASQNTDNLFAYRPVSKWNLDPGQGLNDDFLRWAWPQLETQEKSAPPDLVQWRVISRIDEANGKVGIKHEAIDNLKMPPMNMVFLLADPAQLQGLKVGDAVRFHAENPAGKLTVTAIQKQ